MGPRPNIAAAFEMLEGRLHQLEDAFNTNTKVFSDGFKMVEMQMEVARRVAQDLFEGKSVRFMCPGQTWQTADGSQTRQILIDWNTYLKEYIEELEVNEKKAEDETANGHVLATPDDESPIIFGGE